MKKVLQIIINTISFVITFTGLSIIALYLIGIKPSIVISGSMVPRLPIGSICWINTNYPIEEVKINDIIVYKQQNQKIIHRVVEIEEGIIRTKGDANSYVDGAAITKKNYYGKFLFSVNKVGFLTVKMQTTTGKTIFVTVIMVFYVIQDLINYAVQLDEEKKKNKLKETK